MTDIFVGQFYLDYPICRSPRGFSLGDEGHSIQLHALLCVHTTQIDFEGSQVSPWDAAHLLLTVICTLRSEQPYLLCLQLLTVNTMTTEI